MFPQRQFLDEMVRLTRSGRMKRRTFLERALALGLTSSAASSLLAACGGSGDSVGGNGAALNIVWRSELEPAGVYPKLVERFNQSNRDGIHVTFLHSPIDSARLHSIFLNMLSVRSSDIDVISMDIIWPAEFALNQWLSPITDRWSVSERDKYLPGPIQGCTLGGQIWAAPLRTDVGLIYYRKDLVPNPPKTWDELTATAQDLQSRNVTKYGYVWQGARTEGLVCTFSEVLYGYGGHVLDPDIPRKVTVDSPETLQALSTMVNWVNTISPTVTGMKSPDDARAVWERGDAAFMRNWPNAYALGNKPTSKVAGKFAVTSMPYGGTNSEGHSVIGGWQLGINAFSSPVRVNAAWKFIQFMLGEEAQKTLALSSLASTMKSTYQDSEVQSKTPVFKEIGPILGKALPRPVSPRYPDLTTALQTRVEQALIHQSSPADALAALQNDLQLIETL